MIWTEWFKFRTINPDCFSCCEYFKISNSRTQTSCYIVTAKCKSLVNPSLLHQVRLGHPIILSTSSEVTHPLPLSDKCLFVCRERSCRTPASRTSFPRRVATVSAMSKSESAVATELSLESAQKDVIGALSQIIDPDFGTDIVSCGFVKELSIEQATGQVLPFYAF